MSDPKSDELEHPHATASEYAFQEDRHTGVFICQHVVDGAPVLYASHDSEGDWQFLCGELHADDVDGACIVCLEHVVARDPTLNALARMCENHYAERASVGAAWTITDEGEEFIRQCVAEHGWAVQGVEADDDEPEFAYTVGLQRTFGQPEVIVFGLPFDVAHPVLNDVGERMKAGEVIQVGQRYTGIVDDYDVQFREVRDPSSYEHHVGYALWFHGGPSFRLLQLIWPDKDGVFPGEPDAPTWMARRQPLLP